MTSLIRPTSLLSTIELLEQQLAGPGLQSSLWSSGVNITPRQSGSNPEGDGGLKDRGTSVKEEGGKGRSLK